MYSLNSSFNKVIMFIVMALILTGLGLLLFNAIPFALAAALLIWLLFKLVKFVKSFVGKLKQVVQKDSEEVIFDKDEFDMSDKNVIDVEYKEV